MDDCQTLVGSAALRFTGRTGVIILCDQEKPIKKLHDALLLNTLVGSGASAGSIERANHDVAKQGRTFRSRTEEMYAIQLDMEHQLSPWLVCHAASLITHFQVKADGKTPSGCATVRTTERSLNSPRQCITRTLPRTLARWTTGGILELGSARAWPLTSTTSAPVLAGERRAWWQEPWTSSSGCRERPLLCSTR